MLKFTITALLIILMMGQAYFYGVSDVITLGFVLATSCFLFISLRKVHVGNRKILRTSTKKDSWLYQFLSNEKSLGLILITIVSSILLSSILVVLVKGLVLQHGYWPFFVVIAIASLITYNFINKNHNAKSVEDNIHEDITSHGNELISLFYSAIILNLVLSFAFSAYDTFSFKTSLISFENFTDEALKISIAKTPFNEYTRIFVNAYILMDTIKIALAKMFIDLFGLNNNFYGFYIVIFILNTFKFLAFSVSLVLLQKGLHGFAIILQPILNKTMKVAKSYIVIWFDKLKEIKEKYN